MIFVAVIHVRNGFQGEIQMINRYSLTQQQPIVKKNVNDHEATMVGPFLCRYYHQSYF